MLWHVYRPFFYEQLGRFKYPPPVSTSDHSLGEQNAPVTIIVYTDFECPFCRHLYGELKKLQSDARFRLVYRNYPLDIHANALRLAEASECAAAQGHYWDFVDAVYLSPSPGDLAQFPAAWSMSANLDGAQFQRCMAADNTRDLVQRERTEADELLIPGTPTIYINGRRYVGDIREDELRAILEETADKVRN